jgi:CRP-like cAMP-binding protein
MSARDRIDLLRGCPHFATLSDALLKELMTVVQVRSYDAGETIFLEGESEGSASLHIVEKGTVRIFKVSVEGREQVLRLMRAGDAFSDVPAFDGGGYPASAEALEASVVLAVPRQPLLELMRQYPEIAIGALRAMSSRMRHMTSLVEDLSLRRVMSRVANLLLTNDGSGNLSQSQMASMVGTAREMVNRSLNTLADRKVIELRGHEIVILDRDELREIVERG